MGEPAELVIEHRFCQLEPLSPKRSDHRMTHWHKALAHRHARARSLLNFLQYQSLWRCNAMTRTFGAALGVAIVLLFFASLTFEQNRVLSIARTTTSSHR
jgi:hypothetical protein